MPEISLVDEERKILDMVQSTAGRFLYMSAIVGAYVVGVFLFWHGVVAIFAIPHYIVPQPFDVLASLAKLPSFYARHATVTFSEAALGILLGAFGGFLVGLIMRFGGIVGRIVSPLAIASQVFPKEALAPLFLVYFGFGAMPKVLISALICFFPVAIGTLQGLTATPQGHIRLLASLGASDWQIFSYCQLPFASSHIAASIRVASVLALVGAVVGEFVGSSEGLGHVIRSANSDISTERVFAALLLLGCIGAVLYLSALFFDRYFLRKFSASN